MLWRQSSASVISSAATVMAFVRQSAGLKLPTRFQFGTWLSDCHFFGGAAHQRPVVKSIDAELESEMDFYDTTVEAYASKEIKTFTLAQVLSWLLGYQILCGSRRSPGSATDPVWLNSNAHTVRYHSVPCSPKQEESKTLADLTIMTSRSSRYAVKVCADADSWQIYGWQLSGALRQRKHRPRAGDAPTCRVCVHCEPPTRPSCQVDARNAAESALPAVVHSCPSCSSLAAWPDGCWISSPCLTSWSRTHTSAKCTRHTTALSGC